MMSLCSLEVINACVMSQGSRERPGRAATCPSILDKSTATTAFVVRSLTADRAPASRCATLRFSLVAVVTPRHHTSTDVASCHHRCTCGAKRFELSMSRRDIGATVMSRHDNNFD